MCSAEGFPGSLRFLVCLAAGWRRFAAMPVGVDPVCVMEETLRLACTTQSALSHFQKPSPGGEGGPLAVDEVELLWQKLRCFHPTRHLISHLRCQLPLGGEAFWLAFFHTISFTAQEKASLVQRARRVKKMCQWHIFSQSVEQALPARGPGGAEGLPFPALVASANC